jgi:hypothetical protein
VIQRGLGHPAGRGHLVQGGGGVAPAREQKGADDATVTAVTKRVNGGTIGISDRIKHFKEYFALLK